MKTIVITGGKGFVGRNLSAHLRERKDCEVVIIDQEDSFDDLKRALLESDVIFHLAGVNRPKDPAEFHIGNTGLTEQICEFLRKAHRTPKIVFSSSIQADMENPYGVSKKRAEEVLRQFAMDSNAPLRIYRLKNLFGKWCRPNYNSVTATFCHNIANHLPISVSNPAHEIELTYVDDVVAAFCGEIDADYSEIEAGAEIPSYRISLGELAGRVQAFSEMKSSLTLPDFAGWFNRALYATYLSYVPPASLESRLDIKSDARGSLAEFIKQAGVGQIFISRTKPGITRGNHYHHTKTEKFFVVEGSGLIRIRHIDGGKIEEFFVNGESYQVIDIPPGVTHSITNVGTGELVTLFWSSEVFDPDRPDTYFLPVDFEPRSASTQAVRT